MSKIGGIYKSKCCCRFNFYEAHFKDSLFIDGEWVDDIIYGLLKKIGNTKYNNKPHKQYSLPKS